MNTVDIDHTAAGTNPRQMMANPLIRLDLLQHLLHNLTVPIVVVGAPSVGKTRLLRELQARSAASEAVCYLAATANLTLERVVLEALEILRKPGQVWPAKPAETLLSELLGDLFGSSRRLILLIDDAGKLMPGLIAALFRLAESSPALKLALAMTPDDLANRSAIDGMSLATAHRLRVQPTESVAPTPGSFTRALAATGIELAPQAREPRNQAVSVGLSWLTRRFGTSPESSASGRSASIGAGWIVATLLGIGFVSALGYGWFRSAPVEDRPAPPPAAPTVPNEMGRPLSLAPPPAEAPPEPPPPATPQIPEVPASVPPAPAAALPAAPEPSANPQNPQAEKPKEKEEAEPPPVKENASKKKARAKKRKHRRGAIDVDSRYAAASLQTLTHNDPNLERV